MYEIGDEVIYQGADKSAYKRRGVVAAIEEKDGKPQLTVAFGDGEEFTAPIDDWSRAFTNAAKNAKFKVGDKVTTTAFPSKPGMKDKVWTITEVIRDGYYRVETKYGNSGTQTAALEEKWLHSANSRACNSTNKTVANALNARRAKNAESATDVAGKAGDAYRSAYNELAGCAAYLERIASIGLPNDLSGNDEKTAAWAKKKAQKVRDIMARLDQGRL